MSDTVTGTLTDFLLARIDEDEARYRDAAGDEQHQDWALNKAGDYNEAYIVEEALRRLVECKAKRRIIDIAFKHAEIIDGEWACCHTAEEIRGGQCEVMDPNEDRLLCALALPYVDHPDFRKEWRG